MLQKLKHLTKNIIKSSVNFELLIEGAQVSQYLKYRKFSEKIQLPHPRTKNKHIHESCAVYSQLRGQLSPLPPKSQAQPRKTKIARLNKKHRERSSTAKLFTSISACSIRYVTHLSKILSWNYNSSTINQIRMPSCEDKPASFIGKLCNILRSKEHSKIIYWDSELKGIRILNQKRLQETILPRYFRHNRYASFVRQLNMYDFHKVHLPDHHSIFLHSTFDPKKKENIHLIRRKVNFQVKQTSEKDQEKANLLEVFSQKENNQIGDAFFKSSKNMLYKQSIINFLTEKGNNFQDLAQSSVLQQLLKELIPYKEKKAEFDQKYKKIKSNKKYRTYLKNSKFRHELSVKLGVDWIQEDDVLSELSIEDQLMFKTKKSLPQKSLRLLESGQIYFKKETVANLFNF